MSEDVSRRGLFRLGLRRAAPSVDAAAAKAKVRARWERGAPELLRGLEPLADTVCDVAAVARGERVLDAGAGDGNVALAAARRGAQVSACDLAPGQVERGRARCADAAAAARSAGAAAPGRPVADVTWETGDVEDLRYADGTFDAVLSVLGVALAPRPRRTCRELLRVLRPGGMLVLAVPTRDALAGRSLELAGERLRWGRAENALAFLEAAEPGVDAETREHGFRLAFPSLAAAWGAYAEPFGLAAGAREAFDAIVADRSPGPGAVGVRDHWLLVMARRGV